MEPRPWPEDGATEIEKALLRAGRAEVPRKGADLRLLAMLHGSAPPTIKPATLTRWVKVGLVAIVAGGAAVVGPKLSRPQAVPASDLSARGVGVVTEPSRVALAEGREPGEATVAPTVSERLQAVREKEPRSVAEEGKRGESRRVKPAGSARDHSLGEETKALDHAREALDEHRPSEVLRLLDEYSRRFVHGRLRPEAMILRLAALVQAGGHEAADSLARQLLSDEEYAGYAPRIQSLLRETGQ